MAVEHEHMQCEGSCRRLTPFALDAHGRERQCLMTTATMRSLPEHEDRLIAVGFEGRLTQTEADVTVLPFYRPSGDRTGCAMGSANASDKGLGPAAAVLCSLGLRLRLLASGSRRGGISSF